MDTTKFNLSLLDTLLDYDDPSDYDSTYCLICEHILQKMSITFYSIIFALGIIGNGLVIWITGFRMKKTISAVWFLNLAIADFLCCASIPLRIVDWVYYFFSELPILFCIFSMILFTLNMSASVLLLTAMSIDRWVSVMWPIWAKVHRTCKKARITVGVIWVLSLVFTGFIFYCYKVYNLELYEWCLTYVQNDDESYIDTQHTIHMIRIFIMFLIPFLIILICYVTIFFKVKKCKRSQRSQGSSRIITAVILCFFICWLPYYICPITRLFYESDIQFFTVTTIVINLACLKSCINPIIYVFMGQGFKQTFFRSIPSRLESALNERPNDPCENQEDC
ncbi:C3a anaphylatoxin chemotactic receptor-like isoform X2 [Ranitomeya imitator]|uniref:C3a anaphylatoxin chemotactic receptor-like isoform X2 n=1 Tax=Ranitomeya imitator TaxID=111125 RepID=UPI0037E85710